MSRRIDRPDNAEEAKINQGISQDPDTRVMSDDEFGEAVKRKRGRPLGSLAEVRKEQVTIRLDRDTLEVMRAFGSGWQSRANEILREATNRGAFAPPKPEREPSLAEPMKQRA
jgi:uncharacterized protein (DUF4415 family)